jgi:hypothetical protein
MMMWPAVSTLLNYADKGYSICDAAAGMKDKVWTRVREPWWHGKMKRSGVLRNIPWEPTEEVPRKLEALYITGHSLGGALALLTMALINRLSLPLRVRGVYTYGQPMVGDQDFCNRFQNEFGHMLFRHVYRRDLVPCLPPRTMGRFAHFGEEYGSTDDAGWLYRSGAVRQVCTALGAGIVGLAALAQEQLVGIPALQWPHLPYSLGDHSPISYLRTSMMAAPSDELVFTPPPVP